MRHPRALVVLALTLSTLLVLPAAPANAAVTSATANQVASAMAASSITVTGASFEEYNLAGGATPAGVGDSALTSFPTDGSTFGVVSSGDASDTDDPGTFASTSNGGGNVRGNTDLDVLIMKVDFSVPPTRNCLSFDFQFLSEEFPNFVGSSVNDAFVAELDTSNWTTAGSAISAPNNFAFGPDGNVISVNSTGVANMSAANGAGSSFDGGDDQGGATVLLRASTPVSPGSHSAYFSIFDQGDDIYDSAVFLDNLSLGTTSEDQCVPGAQLPEPTIEKEADSATSTPGAQNGYTIRVSNPNEAAFDVYSIEDELPPGFTYIPGSTQGATAADPDQPGGNTLSWTGPFTVPPEGSISLSFDVTVSEGEGPYDNEATADLGEGGISTGPTATIEVQEPEEPPSIEKTADSSTTEVGGQNGYTITIYNPTEDEVEETFILDTITLDAITDTLPNGFSYVGPTSGLTTEDPTISGGGQTLTWDGPFDDIPSQEEGQLHFGVTVSNTAGDYDNEASAQFGETTLATGPTATITVTAAPLPPLSPPPVPVSLPCDPITAEGGPGGDRMIGGIGADRIRSLAGRDIVDAGAGDDEICGGDGGDFLYGRSGSDIIRGEGGNDRLYGGLHADTLYGDAGHDALIGGKGADTFFTQDGVKDCIMTGKGQDIVHGDVGLDLVDPRGGCPPGF